ncbi:MAG TPA: sigma-70 family RNA polymerase sigma factor [Phycisphaerae bacterium]|nr:sigma-70 family RNA polymerase sigma factor [Phycisphaerae bacterium]HRY66685.1 sigma-70 family RNA polymerase sigma factor [Phycisphaerae bacterium]HSA27612.1 sigma-70 family RNA polymerase sigma factor [Phycisphaerae bacterium]
MHTTQTDLLRAVRDTQNREAWGQFYRIYTPMLCNFARRLGLSDADTDDLSQEVLMIAHRSLRDSLYDPNRGSFRKYLYGIAHRQALATFRARGRRTRVQSVTPESGVNLLDQLEDHRSEETVREIWDQEWRYAMLDEALRHVRSEVGEKPYQSFTLFAIDRRPVQEVADQVGIAVASVYVYKSRVLDAIRRWIAQFEDRD